ncbi:NIPSNAP family protein [Rhodopirellula baltica]|uniref:NIPSNAP family containing protein n=1 Tax=Rhodopirellula baltica WH47 TaxID=991778 RepID=F2ASJ9_RHOBT|nr:NIPSNAP family protein [Rhodopirellula baltica]EGF27348.1 NIPSNAP family containing protein [Rhodopirellula baltica WH47]
MKTPPMKRWMTFGWTAALCLTACLQSDMSFADEYYEVRTIVLGDKGDAAAVDQYLEKALIPALERQNIGPVGVFAPKANSETKEGSVFVIIPFTELGQMESSRAALAEDSEYQKAAADYLGRDAKSPPYSRISSELLTAMDCWPKTVVPDGTLENDERVYELRLYESANERLGDLKVEMFNAGEVPIFLDSGIQPIFIGQALVGPQMPSLTYLTVYKNEAAREKAWDAFRAHPDWKVLSKNPRYGGTVSRIDKFVLSAKPYSQM